MQWPVQLYKPDFGTTPDRSLPSFDSIGQLGELKFSISCWNSKDSPTLRHGKGSPWQRAEHTEPTATASTETALTVNSSSLRSETTHLHQFPGAAFYSENTESWRHILMVGIKPTTMAIRFLTPISQSIRSWATWAPIWLILGLLSHNKPSFKPMEFSALNHSDR